MKMPKPRRLPSGAWNVRVMIDGLSVSITRPTEKECLLAAAAAKAGKKIAAGGSMTLSEAIDKYIELKAGVLSASTIRGYRCIQKNRLQTIMDRPASTISNERLQRAVNFDSAKLSAKTVKNTVSFVQTVLADVCGVEVSATLPQVIRPDYKFIQPEDLPAFVQAIRGYKQELMIILCLHGLRASEAMNVQRKDIDLGAGVIHVRGAAVKDEHGLLVHQQANKNTTSRRDVPILIDRLREIVPDVAPGAYLFDGTCGTSLYHAVQRGCRRAGIPAVSVHDLRRTFASTCYNAGISEAVCMALGGWADLYTMRAVYCQVSGAKYAESLDALKSAFKMDL